MCFQQDFIQVGQVSITLLLLSIITYVLCRKANHSLGTLRLMNAEAFWLASTIFKQCDYAYT